MVKNILKIFIPYILLILFLIFVVYPYTLRILLRRMAIDTINALNKCGVDYWVDFGTLLGIVREGDIILWDPDIDIITVECEDLHDKMKEVKNILTRKGYNFKKESWDAYRVYLYFWHVDIYINKRDTNVYIGSTGETSNIPIEYIGSKSIIRWNNLDVKCPERIHETLVWRYGQDYMVPKYNYKGRNS